MREIIFQAFNWKLTDITSNLQDIKDSGFTSIQTSPLQGTKDNGSEFWKLYQPIDIKFVDSRIGTKEEFKVLCYEANKLGLKVIVDIVLRHVAGVNDGRLIPHESVNKELLQFIKSIPNTTDYNDRNQVINYSTGMPMLDYENLDLIQIYNEFLRELTNLGCDGFRLDQLKHFGLPSEGYKFFNKIKLGNSPITYGEVLECDYNILSEYNTFLKSLSWSNCNENMSRVLFIESHDTFHTWASTKNMSDDMIINAWIDLLKNNPKNNVIWFARPFNNSWKSNKIKYINLDNNR